EAADVLRQLLAAQSEAVRLGAARALLDLAVKLRAAVEIDQRLQALEERLSEPPGERRCDAPPAPAPGPRRGSLAAAAAPRALPCAGRVPGAGRRPGAVLPRPGGELPRALQPFPRGGPPPTRPRTTGGSSSTSPPIRSATATSTPWPGTT